MIHLTLAVPQGIDSLFFSFVQRLAEMNDHQCSDDSSERFDDLSLTKFIREVASSKRHHFLVGYRYPPKYWKQLCANAETIVVLADGDGIARQVESILNQEMMADKNSSTLTVLQGMKVALDQMLSSLEMCLSLDSPKRLAVPSQSFMISPSESFRRIELFYKSCGVSCGSPSWEKFSNEAAPFLAQLTSPCPNIRREIHRFIAIDDVTPGRIASARLLFGDV
jgi:hypothetical protein